MKLLLLEDNPRAGTLLRDHLTRAGYVTDLVSTIEQFLEYTLVSAYDIYLIDLGLPDGDGLSAIQQIRGGRGDATPILIVTARTSIQDRIAGLDSAADDYLCKPFHVDELLARVRALLRRRTSSTVGQVKAGSLVLRCDTGDIFYNGQRVELRDSERQLLALMIRKSGRVVPKTLIEDSLWRANECKSSNTIEKLVSRLRKSVSLDEMGVTLRTVRNTGYVLEEVPARPNRCARQPQV